MTGKQSAVTKTWICIILSPPTLKDGRTHFRFIHTFLASDNGRTFERRNLLFSVKGVSWVIISLQLMDIRQDISMNLNGRYTKSILTSSLLSFKLIKLMRSFMSKLIRKYLLKEYTRELELKKKNLYHLNISKTFIKYTTNG